MEPGSILWINLGHSYGKWPAIVAEHQQRPVLNKDILNELGEHFHKDKEEVEAGDQLFVRFFDDDDFELLPVNELNQIESYSCKNKKKYIRAGFRKHEENKKGNLGGANLRLAQFYKDVEMAEVMTDNDQAVAKILASYEIAETGEGENEPQSAENVIPEGYVTGSGDICGQNVTSELAGQPEVAKKVKLKTAKKSAKKGTRLKKDVLTQINNGRISKSK